MHYAIIVICVLFTQEFNNSICANTTHRDFGINITVEKKKNDGKNVMDFYIQKKVDNRGKKIAKSNY